MNEDLDKKVENFPEDRDGNEYDPKERDPKYRDIIKKAKKEAEEILEKEYPGGKNRMGYCHHLWGEKKRILKEKYNIDWMTPGECNPGIMFD